MNNYGVISNNMILPIGDYPVEVRAYNLYNESVSAEFTVTVDDTIAPEISEAADVSYLEGAVGNIPNWTATDLGPVSYSISLDGTVVKSGTWNSSGEVISIGCDGLSVGEHTYIIIITDIGGNSVTDTVVVTVTEALIPAYPAIPLILAVAGAGVVILLIVVYLFKKKSAAT